MARTTVMGAGSWGTAGAARTAPSRAVITTAAAWSATPNRRQIRGCVHCTLSITKMYTCSSAASAAKTVARIATMSER